MSQMLQSIDSNSHDTGKTCVCVTHHVPKPNELNAHHVWPLGEGGPEDGEILWLCPTMHVNIHELWRFYKKYGDIPPWSVLRAYSHYCREIVEKGWRLAHATRSYT